MTTKPIQVGLVGCGNAGRSIHMKLLGEHAATYRVMACADSVRESAARLAADFGIRAASSVDALVSDPAVELVVVATRPPSSHRDVAIKAFAAGKHVVVEKPMAGTEAECGEMIAAAQAARRTLAVHHNRRWDVDFLAAREAIESGALGELRLVRNEYTAGFEGSAYDWGIHIVDQTMALSRGRKFVELSSTLCTPNTDAPLKGEGFFSARLRTEDGVVHDMSMLPVFNGSAFRPGKMAFRFMLAGTAGVLYLDWCQRPEDALARPIFFQPAGKGKSFHEPTWVTAKLAIPDFYDTLHHAIRTGSPPPVSGEEGRRAVRAWQLVCAAAAKGKTLSISL